MKSPANSIFKSKAPIFRGICLALFVPLVILIFYGLAFRQIGIDIVKVNESSLYQFDAMRMVLTLIFVLTFLFVVTANQLSPFFKLGITSNVALISLGTGLIFNILATQLYQLASNPPEASLTLFHRISIQYSDFFDMRNLVLNMNPYGSERWGNYLPFGYLFFVPFRYFSEAQALLVFLVFAIGLWLGTVLLLFKNLVKSNALSLVLIFSFPLVFCLSRGNSEVFLATLTGLFFWHYQRKMFNLAYCFLGLAIAMKGYPATILLFLLFLADFKGMFKTIALAIVLSGLSIFAFQGSISEMISASFFGFTKYKNLMVDQNEGLAFGHSLITGLKILNSYFLSNFLDNKIAFLVFFSGAMWAFLAKLKKGGFLPIEMYLVTLCLFMLFMPVSPDYRFLHFVIPALMILNNPTSSQFEKRIFVIICLLLVPKNYFVFYYYVNSGTVVNCLLLVSLLVCLLQIQNPSRARTRSHDTL